ncbi:ADP-ribosylation factor family/Signal recognition particle receptor beta subunit/50S ribosome-binding GTPase/Ras of Complex, Roc, domain of DAPkinase/Gtr1/RagA G protein conserved region/Ras family, putative [Leishmania lindenbergi]|uniref:ADP-ribosylation factor-like protein 3 n=1 Tax=Leishmania lindenbergi TaxID=651832 RepID=A0AAW2ZU21_9TRYP
MGILDFLVRIRRIRRPAGILILGLDSAGKTSILRQLSDEDVSNVASTQGFQIKKLVSGGIKLNVWDMGGQRAARYYWRQYFKQADVIIYVVDAANPRRIHEARRELEHLLEEEKVAGVPMLFFANKQDLLGALSVEEITVALNLTDLRDRRWHIQACSAKTGEGLDEGISWAVKQVKK